MKQIKRILISILMTAVLIPQTIASAADYKGLVEENRTLNEQKSSAEKEEKELNNKLEDLKKEIGENQKKLDAKKQEVSAAEEKLSEARAVEEKQQDAMEKRIRYLYENDMDLFEIFLTSQSMADFLAKTEYVQEISSYDRDMLKKFEETRKEIERIEKKLKKEKEELEKTEDDLYKKQNEVTTLLEEKKAVLKDVSEKLEKNIAELNKLMDESGTPGPWIISGAGYLSNPCPAARISSEFGPRRAPTAGASSYHQGRDYAAPAGTPMYAAAEGVVTTVGYHSIRGNYMVIRHPNGLSTWYQHCTTIFAKQGQTVARGDKIATVGSTGLVTGPHLHFIVEEPGGKLVDPRKYL